MGDQPKKSEEEKLLETEETLMDYESEETPTANHTIAQLTPPAPPSSIPPPPLPPVSETRRTNSPPKPPVKVESSSSSSTVNNTKPPVRGGKPPTRAARGDSQNVNSSQPNLDKWIRSWEERARLEEQRRERDRQENEDRWNQRMNQMMDLVSVAVSSNKRKEGEDEETPAKKKRRSESSLLVLVPFGRVMGGWSKKTLGSSITIESYGEVSELSTKMCNLEEEQMVVLIGDLTPRIKEDYQKVLDAINLPLNVTIASLPMAHPWDEFYENYGDGVKTLKETLVKWNLRTDDEDKKVTILVNDNECWGKDKVCYVTAALATSYTKGTMAFGSMLKHVKNVVRYAKYLGAYGERINTDVEEHCTEMDNTGRGRGTFRGRVRGQRGRGFRGH